MTRDIPEKDKKDWENFIESNEKLPNKDLEKQDYISFKTRSIDFVFKGNFFFNLSSLSSNFSLLERKVSQSFLSLSEILSVNYVNVLTSCQLGFAEVVSLEKTHVS